MPYRNPINSLHVPDQLCSPLLTDENGLPRYWVTVWSILRTNDLAVSTEMQRLRHIEALYVFADQMHGPGCLDDILGSCRIEELGNLLEAYFVSLRNRSEVTESTQKRWYAGMSFVKDVVLRLTKSGTAIGKLVEAEKRLMHLDALYGQLRIRKSKRPDILRSLPAVVVSHLYETLDPESPENPFSRVRAKWTVFLAFVLMLHQGLRRGELLLLPADVVKSGFDKRQLRQRYWMNIQDDEKHADQDKRYNKPSIKTADSIRQVPVSELTANLIQTYIENFRGKPDHPFLLNTQWNTPLSHDSLTAYFAKLTTALPADMLRVLHERTGKKSIEPHDLRHTAAVVRLNQLLSKNVPMDEALQQLRTFFGWARTSDMPRRYARAVFEDRLSDVWSKVLDDRIEILKSIPKGLG